VSFWDRYWSWETWGWMSLAGLSYAVHFITWIWSLDLTSLAHSLLFVTLTPMLFVIWKVICCKSIHLYEVVGCVMGMLGLGLMVADYAIEGEERVDYRGDMLAFVGAVAAVGFMAVASKLRKFIPLHLYAFPSTFMSTLPVLVTTVAVDGTVANTVESNSLWGFFSSEYLLLTALIALGPGYFGHTGSALVMKRLSPLSVSLAWTCEPLFGYLMGLVLGVASKASVFTFIGGPLNMLGVVLALYGGHLRGEEQRLIRLREAEKRTQYELQVAAPPSIIECTAAAPSITSSL
jgi:drug/metabolite transporter (DMT)-like permease